MNIKLNRSNFALFKYIFIFILGYIVFEIIDSELMYPLVSLKASHTLFQKSNNSKTTKRKIKIEINLNR